MKRKVGRPPKLSVDQIVDAALADGIGTFGMSSVARRLGVSHSGLYRYFEDYDSLVMATIDKSLRSREWPTTSGQPWREALVGIGDAIWGLCEDVPGIDRTMLASKGSAGAAEELASGWVHGLTEQGFSVEDAGIAVDFIVLLTITSSALLDRLDTVMVQRTSGSDTDPALRQIADDHQHRDRGWFDIKVQIFLDGLALRLQQ